MLRFKLLLFAALLFLSENTLFGQAKQSKPTKTKAVASSTTGASAYSIKIKIKGLKDTSCYLAYHMGDKQYLADTAKVDKNGTMVFTGKESLDGGIYMVVLPSKKYFEIIVNEQNFTIEADTVDLGGSVQTPDSKENKIFIEYLKFVQVHGRKMEGLQQRLRSKSEPADSVKVIRTRLAKSEESLSDFRSDLAAKNPGTFMSTLLRALTDPKRPTPPLASNGRPDSVYKFYDTRAHYFDNIDFGDDRLLRTPILLGKVKYYIENLYPQEPDSINRACDVVLDNSKKNKQMFRYFLWYISNQYETSKFMGMDAVFVHVAGKYYLSKDVDWIDEPTRKKISERVNILTPLLLGKKAPYLMMKDTASKPVVLQSLKSQYTVIVFYDPNCGHCQKDIPRLNNLYRDTLKAKGVAVYAACAERDRKAWLGFVRKNKLEFLNVFDQDTIVDFRNGWDVYSFPVIYVLDEQKKIVAKRIGVEDINNLVNTLDKIKKDEEKDKAKASSKKQ